MSSRQEEKEQRRLEREQQEAVERRGANRKARVRMALGALAALAVIGGIVALLLSQSGDGGGNDDGRRTATNVDGVTLPEPVTTSLQDAAKTAGCELTNAKFEGAGHEERKFTAADYKSNPPTSGAHFPTWYEDGIYEPGSVPDLGQLVHTLEHGRINVQYKPGTPAQTVKQLEAFAAEKTGYHLLLYENTTDMPFAVAATAWTQTLSCDEMKPEVFDALRTFYQQYVDKGPEQVQ